MTDEDFPDLGKFFSDLRKSASINAGAVMFGEAQVAYYNTLKQHMTEEMAYNLLAHTTEHILRSMAAAAGPLAEALLKASALWEALGKSGVGTDKEVPGGGS